MRTSSKGPLEKVMLFTQIFPKNVRKMQLLLMIVVLFGSTLMLLNMTYGKEKVPSGSKNLNLYFVIDTSLSMLAKDYGTGQTRLEAMKELSIGISRNNSGAKFSLITFDHKAFTDLPLTSDSVSFENAINSLYPPDPFYAQGSSVDSGIKELATRIKANKTDSKKMVILVTDGGGKKIKDSFGNLYKDSDLEINVVGIGTEKGAQMFYNSTVVDKYAYKAESQVIEGLDGPVTSKYESKYTTELVGLLKGKLHRIETKDDVIKTVENLSNVKADAKVGKKNKTYRDRPIYWLIALALLPFLLGTKYLWFEKVKVRRLEVHEDY